MDESSKHWRELVAVYVRRGHRTPYDLVGRERHELVAEYIREEGLPSLDHFLTDFGAETRLATLYEHAATSDPHRPDAATHAIGWRVSRAIEAAVFVDGVSAEFERLTAAEERLYPSDGPEAMPPAVGR